MLTAVSLKPSKFVSPPVAIRTLRPGHLGTPGQRFRLWEGFDNPRGKLGRLLRLGAGSARVRFDEGIEVADFVDGDGNGHNFVAKKVKETDWSLGTLVVPIKEDGDMAENSDLGPEKEPGRFTQGKALSLRKSRQIKEEDEMAKSNGKGNGASLKPAKAAAKAATKVAKPTGDNPCRCGCGARVSKTYAPGHDARVFGWFKKVANGKMEFSDLPKTIQREVGDVKGLKKELAAHSR